MNVNLAILIPVVAILATAWVIVTALRHSRRSGGHAASAGAGDPEESARLARENAELRQTIGALEQRLQVLERIATDPAERTAREIEMLR
jgi:hypothetical protein